MALDDRDYYREELARKRGVRRPAPFGQPIATRAKRSSLSKTRALSTMPAVAATTPLLDTMIAEKRQPRRWPWLTTFAALASVIAAEAAWLLHSWH
jgi:hypothetical protein